MRFLLLYALVASGGLAHADPYAKEVEARRERFRKETVHLARVQHPNLVNVLGQGVEPWFRPREAVAAAALAGEAWFKEFSRSDQSKLFLALEWIEGHTLEQVYQDRRPPGPSALTSGAITSLALNSSGARAR